MADIQAGSLDTGWDGDGSSRISVGPAVAKAHASVLQDDGKLVVTGDATNGTQFSLVRYKTDGTPDDTFDFDGRVLTSIPGADPVDGSTRAFAIARDGTDFVVAGQVKVCGWFRWAVARYDQNGALTGFGTTTVTMGTANCVNAGYWSTAAYGVTIQPGGKIVLAGCANDGEDKFALARLNPNGSLDDGGGGDQNPADTNFGSGGRTLTPVPGKPAGGDAYATSIVLDANGIVTGGWATVAGSNRFVLMRHSADGALDNTFGGGGGVAVNNVRSGARIMALARRPDGALHGRPLHLDRRARSELRGGDRGRHVPGQHLVVRRRCDGPERRQDRRRRARQQQQRHLRRRASPTRASGATGACSSRLSRRHASASSTSASSRPATETSFEFSSRGPEARSTATLQPRASSARRSSRTSTRTACSTATTTAWTSLTPTRPTRTATAPATRATPTTTTTAWATTATTAGSPRTQTRPTATATAPATRATRTTTTTARPTAATTARPWRTRASATTTATASATPAIRTTPARSTSRSTPATRSRTTRA